jgi:hypothetical protein
MEEYLQNLIAGFVVLLFGVVVVGLSFSSFFVGIVDLLYGVGLVAVGMGLGALFVVYSVYKLEKKLV